MFVLYFNSVTLACYSTTIIGLCHKKVMTNIEVWCYPYPTDYQRITQTTFVLGGRPLFFSQLCKCFTFLFIYVYMFYIFVYKLNTSTLG